MTGITVNQNPLMTEYLVKELRAFAQAPLTFLDIGARGGANEEWKIFGDQARTYCFEPDEEECRRLMADAPKEVHYIPYALGGTEGRATLYETSLPASTGLYKTRMDYFGRLLNRDNGVTVAERTVHVRTLDEIALEQRITNIDFIKADAEGAEFDILSGGSRTLANTNVLGILSEIRFQQEINGSPTFSALDAFLGKCGFRLFDLTAYRQSRRVLPYPGFSNYQLPSGERFFAYTKRGQVQDGDALYFRDLLLPESAELLGKTGPVKLLKLCALLELYSLSDCAAELILANANILEPVVRTEVLLDLLASGMAGQTVSYRDYLRDYFSISSSDSSISTAGNQQEHPVEVTSTTTETRNPIPALPPVEQAPPSALRRLVSWLARQ